MNAEKNYAQNIYEKFINKSLTINLNVPQEDIEKWETLFKLNEVETEYQYIGKALEKQIPMKPTASLPNWYFCACGRSIKRRIGKSKHDILYCPYCGQRLDWGEE